MLAFRRMTSHLSVLLLGPSSVQFSESGEGSAMPALLSQALGQERPSREWTCQSRLLFFGEAMSRRALSLVEALRPDAVALMFSSVDFGDDFVSYRIRNRHPRLFPAFLAASRAWKAVSGGGPEGSPGPRGWLFRLPFRFTRWAVGADPAVPLPEAIRFAIETLDTLLRIESLGIVCRLTTPIPFYEDRLEEHKRRVRVFNDSIGRYCSSHRIAHYDVWQILQGNGLGYGLADDRLHADFPTRRFDAQTMAQHLLPALT